MYLVDKKTNSMTLKRMFLVRDHTVQWGWPTISTGAVFGMLAGVLAGTVESIGDYYACARLAGAPPPPTHAVNRGSCTNLILKPKSLLSYVLLLFPLWVLNQCVKSRKCTVISYKRCQGVAFRRFLARNYTGWSKKRYPSFNFAITSVNVHRL